MIFLCPDCQSPLEEIKACGCRDLFCNSCNQLVSKKRAMPAEQPTPAPVLESVKEGAQR